MIAMHTAHLDLYDYLPARAKHVMPTLRKMVVHLNGLTLQSGLLAISAGLLLLLLASGCGTGASNVPQAEPQSRATPSAVVTATPPRQAAAPSETPTSYVEATETLDEYDASSLPAASNVVQDAVRAQFAVDSFRIDHEYSQVNKSLVTGGTATHTFTATAEIMPPGKMHLVMVSNMSEEERGRVSEVIDLGDIGYRKDQQEDMSYRWVKTEADGTPFDSFQMAYSFWDHADQMTFAGTESLDGMETAIYEYVYDQKALKQTDKVWISVDDGLLRKVELTINTFIWEGKTAAGTSDTLATFVFYDYNGDIKIEAPVDAL